MKNILLSLAVLCTSVATDYLMAGNVALGPYPMITSEISNATSIVATKVVSNDNRRVVFAADIDESSGLGIYMVPVTGGNPVRLNPEWPIDFPYSYRVSRPYLTQDSRRVLFTQRTAPTLNSSALYASPITGNAPPIILFESNQSIDWWFAESDAGVYVWENRSRISLVPVRGGASQLLASLPAGVSVQKVLIGPHPSRLERIAQGDQIIILGSDKNIYRYVFGQASAFFTRINVTNFEGFVPHSHQDTILSPDGSHLLLNDNATNSLYTLSLQTGNIFNVSPRVNSGQDFRGYAFSPDSSRVIYVSDRLVNSRYDIYSSSLNGSQVLNLTPGSISRFGIDGELRFIASSQQVIFQAALTDGTFIASVNGGVAAERLCVCSIAELVGLDPSVETVMLLQGDGLYYYSLTEQKVLPVDTDYKLGHLTALTGVIFLRWITPNRTFVYGIKRVNDEGTGEVTLYRGSLNRNGANTASIFETRNSTLRCPGVSEYIFRQNGAPMILGVTNQSCTKLAYFKVATDDRKVSQVSKYVSAQVFSNTNDARYHFDKDAFYTQRTLTSPANTQMGFSPRGTHLFLPANRRGIGFWGIDLRRETQLDESLCFPVEADNGALVQICY